MIRFRFVVKKPFPREITGKVGETRNMI